MASKTISFLSSRNRGFSPDLQLVKGALARSGGDINLRYYVSSEMTSNSMVKKGRKKAKGEFCRELSYAICIDSSLPAEFAHSEDEEKRILIAVPFEYQFKHMLALENDPEFSRGTFQRFTHVFAPSPFTCKLLKDAYKLEGVQLIDGYCAPVSWEINRPERRAQIKDSFAFHYPGMRGKKIISLVTEGKIGEEKKEFFENFDLERFLARLGDDWFLLTNNWFFLERAAVLAPDYIRSFGYIKEVIPAWHVLYVSDMLITNHSTYACWFAACQKPLYYLGYNNKVSEEYMKQHYSELYLEQPEKLFEIPITDDLGAEVHRRFCDAFSYSPAADPCEAIRSLIME